jgi:L-iditol 2-dehydrogenase
MGSVGVCGSDVHYYQHGRIGDFVVRAPLVLGHEGSGVVVALGEKASRHHLGDRVALEPGIPCGCCIQCRRGRYNLCPDVAFFATPPIDGLFTEYVSIDERFAHDMPDSLSSDAGAMIEPLSVAVWANRKAGTTVGSRVLVTGCGPIGVLAAQVARASGAGYVAITDVSPARLEQASAMGVHDAIDVRGRVDLASLAPDILIECTGLAAVAKGAISALQPAGQAVLVGMGPTDEQELPTALIQARELTVTGAFRYANTYSEAISLAASGAVSLDPLVGARLPLAEAERALQMGKIDPSVLKTIVSITG